jgi:hypothetical protein
MANLREEVRYNFNDLPVVVFFSRQKKTESLVCSTKQICKDKELAENLLPAKTENF